MFYLMPFSKDICAWKNLKNYELPANRHDSEEWWAHATYVRSVSCSVAKEGRGAADRVEFAVKNTQMAPVCTANSFATGGAAQSTDGESSPVKLHRGVGQVLMCPGPNHQSSPGIQCMEQIRARNMEQDNVLLPKATLPLTVLSCP